MFRVRWSFGGIACYGFVRDNGFMGQTTDIEQATPMDRSKAELVLRMVAVKHRIVAEIVNA